MFDTLSRSWDYAKLSYGIVWDFKQLLVFPLVSMAASLVVVASFVLPLWTTGTLEAWMAATEGASDGAGTQAATTGDQVLMYATLFAFYFCSSFVITYFNAALIACAMKVVNGEAPSVGYGFAMASKRLPQILGWSLVSAIVGVLLKTLENNKKTGAIVSAVLGTAWTAMTYFAVPVLVMEGVGPITAIKRSLGTLKGTWGTALVGQFSMGLIGFLVALPVILVVIVLGALAFSSGNSAGIVAAVAVGATLVLLLTAVTSAADMVFKAVLYNHATGNAVPARAQAADLEHAFAQKD